MAEAAGEVTYQNYKQIAKTQIITPRNDNLNLGIFVRSLLSSSMIRPRQTIFQGFYPFILVFDLLLLGFD
jgi:hypothetical protein